jgi:uncharacterized protein YprB with RNaseH-like and TPR domain
MAAPVAQLRKDQIVRLSKLKCKHSHTYLDHWACYLEDYPGNFQEERVGYFDIEANNLKADYGLMLSWAILDEKTGVTTFDCLSPKDARSADEDKRIVQSCVDTLRNYDRIVTYYGSGYDFPFLRARALMTGVEFPKFGEIGHKDLYFTIRSKFALSSRRLENACRQLVGTTGKTRIDAKYWRAAVLGDQKAMAYIVEHNIADVDDLRKLYHKTIEYSKGTKVSI